MASELSPWTTQWTSLFSLFTTIAFIVGAVVFGFLIFTIIRYRYRDGVSEPSDTPQPGTFPKDRGKPLLLFALSMTTLTIISTLVIGTFGAFDFLLNPPIKAPESEDALIIKVVGFQWNWRFRYPNGVETVGELVVPANKVIIFKVTSIDVKHKLGIPDFKIGVDAIPGYDNEIWLQPMKQGEYWIRCYELCGVGHALMAAKMKVVSEAEFESWLQSMSGGG